MNMAENCKSHNNEFKTPDIFVIFALNSDKIAKFSSLAPSALAIDFCWILGGAQVKKDIPECACLAKFRPHKQAVFSCKTKVQSLAKKL